MSESDLKKLREYFQKIQREYDTPEKATALLQREGLIDENGEPSLPFRETGTACQWSSATTAVILKPLRLF